MDIEKLREQEAGCIACIIHSDDKGFTHAKRMFENTLVEIRAKIKQFYETTILD